MTIDYLAIPNGFKGKLVSPSSQSKIVALWPMTSLGKFPQAMRQRVLDRATEHQTTGHHLAVFAEGETKQSETGHQDRASNTFHDGSP